MKNLFLVPFHANETEKIILAEVKRLGISSFENCLWLVSSVRRTREIQKALPENSAKEGLIPPGFFTIKTLAKELFLSFDDRVLIDNSKRLIILHRLLNRMKDDLSPLMPEGSPYFFPGILKSVSLWVKNIKDFIVPSIGIDGALKLLESKASLYQIPQEVWQKGSRVIHVFKKYEKLLSEKGLVDEEDLVLNLPSLIRKMAKPELLIIDGFYNLTNSGKKAFEAIIDNSKNSIAVCFCDEADKDAYSASEPFIDFLIKKDFKPETLTVKKREIKREITEYSSMEGEVEGIANRIKILSLKENVNPSDIAVTFPDISKYELTIKRVFKKYNIDFSIATPQLLLNTPSVMPVLKCLKAINEDFPRRLFASVLRSPYFKKVPEEIKFSGDDLSIRAGIIKGGDEWVSCLEALQKEALKEKEENEEKFANPRLPELIDKLINFLKKFLPIAKKLKAESGHTFKEYRDILEELLELLEWSALEKDGIASREEEKEMKEFRNLLYDFVLAEEVIGGEQLDFSGFLKLLHILLNTKSFLPEKKNTGIEFLNISDAGNIKPRALFFGGLIEGEYPKKPPKDLILPERLKKDLSLLTIDELLEFERFDFEKLLVSPRTRLLLSYPVAEEDKLYLASPFLMDIMQGQPAKVLDFSYDPAKKEVFSYEEFLRIKGLIEEKRFQGEYNPENLNFKGPLLEFILTKYGTDALFYATELEVYGKCPHLFYLERVLRLKEISEPTEEWDPGTWGRAVHSVLHRFFKKEISSETGLAEFKEGILMAANDLSKDEGLPPFMQEALLAFFDSLSDFLLKQEINFRKDGYHPFHLEKRLEVRLEENIRLAGRIDRIDSNKNSLRIIDYKTGNSPELAEIKKGTSLQMPVYCILAEKNFSGKKIEEAGILNLKEREWKEYFKKHQPDFENALVIVQQYVESIRNGKFPKAPNKGDLTCTGYFAGCPFLECGACGGEGVKR